MACEERKIKNVIFLTFEFIILGYEKKNSWSPLICRKENLQQ